MVIEIHDWYDLNEVRKDLNGDYVLMNNLDEDTEGYEELVDTEEGWEPIGDGIHRFTGTFYGREHEIRDFHINKPGERGVGLFRGIGEEGVIIEIDLVVSSSIANSRVGTLVGWNNGHIEKCYADGKVIGEEEVGGLVGHNSILGTVKNSHTAGSARGIQEIDEPIGEGPTDIGGIVGKNLGRIINCYATSSVIGGKYIGGLVGWNRNGTVKNSYATGSVRGVMEVGGLVGENKGRMVNCYATGHVIGDEEVGGLVGWNDKKGTISNSYSVGNVNGSSFHLRESKNIGGLAGLNPGTIENSFWNIETSGQDESTGGIGLRTAEITGKNARRNMDSFDFKEIWETVEKEHEDAEKDGYPILRRLSREKQLKAKKLDT